MVYPADDLLLRARFLRKAAQEGARPWREILDELASLVTEVSSRAREETADGASPPPDSVSQEIGRGLSDSAD
jgi:hypothetical protein